MPKPLRRKKLTKKEHESITQKEQFKKAKRHPLYPEPGASILSSYEGLPKLQPPEPLKEDAILDASMVDTFVSYEGLGYCIYEYLPSGKIADKRLRELWERAREAMESIVIYLDSVPQPKIKKRLNREVRKRKAQRRVEVVEDVEEL